MTRPQPAHRLHPLLAMGAALGRDTEADLAEIQRRAITQLAAPDCDVIPIKGACDETLTELGFTLGDPVDDLWRQAQLPAGWARRTLGDDHVVLTDDSGRPRLLLHHTAHPQDRTALMGVLSVQEYAAALIQGWTPLATDPHWATTRALTRALCLQRDLHPPGTPLFDRTTELIFDLQLPRLRQALAQQEGHA